MTTEYIRKNIKVMGYSISNIGIYITYFFGDNLNLTRTIDLPPLQAIIALERLGAISRFEVNPTRIWWDSPKGAPMDAPWEIFCETFTFSQYEAISIAVRHEYEKSLDADRSILELVKALEALR